jgi:cytochrome c peroxidase
VCNDVARDGGNTTSVLGLVAAVLGLAACAGGSAASPQPSPSAELSPLASLGEKIFHDTSLSASGRLSCAVCHDAGHALAAADALAVPLGGADGRQPGLRNAPSLRYVTKTPAFFFAADGTPTGGFDRDGRASSLAEQARRPFLTSFEMANAGAADVAAKLSAAAYAADFRAQFGAQIFAQPDAAFERALVAIQQYELEDTAEFAPFTSRYDYFLAGRARLTDAELRGLALFNDPEKGNCAACHPSARGANGEPPLFTDFTYDNIGVPRNADIAANADPAYYDLGLCGPQRTDLADRLDLCGAFKVPTLRNIALTAPYFHNGRFTTLTDALGFYVRRDTNPGEWYPMDSQGVVHKFDDLPPQFVANVNRTEVPYNRLPGDSPALDAGEIADVISFLQTLTDGYQP